MLLLCLNFPVWADSTPSVSISLLEFCPLHCINSEGQPEEITPGYAVEIYQKIFTDAGYDIRFIYNPFNRGMVEVNKGNIDAISGPLRFSESELQDKVRQMPRIGPLYGEMIYPTETIGTHLSSCVFVRSNYDFVYSGVSSLDDQRVGAAHSYNYGEEMNEYLEKRMKNSSSRISKLSGNHIFIRNIKKLLLNRIDIVLMDRFSGNHAIQMAENEGVIESNSVSLAGCSGVPSYLYLAFSKANPEKSQRLAQIFDEGIRKIRQSGELQIILEKYGVQDWILD